MLGKLLKSQKITMKTLFKISIACLMLISLQLSAKAQTFSFQYDPDDVDVPGANEVPDNVPSIAELPSNDDIISVQSYKMPLPSQEYYVLPVSDMGVPNGTDDYRTGDSEQQYGNSIVFSHNNLNSLILGAYGTNAPLDMSVVKRKNGQQGSVWAYRLGDAAYHEEGRIIIKDDATLDRYLLVGTTNRYGNTCVFAALIKDAGNSISTIWANTYPSSSSVDQIPTSVYRDANGDFVVMGYTGGASSDLFAFVIKNNGVIGSNMIYFDTGLPETSPHISQSAGNGAYMVSYTAGNSNGSAIGVMELSANLGNVLWNNYYLQVGATFNHSVAVFWNGTEYVVGTGHHQVTSGGPHPGFLRLTSTGAVNGLETYSIPENDFYRRTQCMIPAADGEFIIKYLYDDLFGYGLLKVNSNGTLNAPYNTCHMDYPVEVLPVQTLVEHELGFYEFYTTISSYNEDGQDLNGDFYDCAGTSSGTFFIHNPDKVEEPEIMNQSASETATSLEEVGSNQLQVYPNPSNGLFKVSFGIEIPSLIQVTDLSSRVLINITSPSEKETINLRGYDSGIYLLITKRGSQETQTKLVLR